MPSRRNPTMVYKLVARAFKAGIYAEYVLMDTWFTNEPMLMKLRRNLGIHVIGMVKQLKQQYFYKGVGHCLASLHKIVKNSGVKSSNPDIIGSIIVNTKNGIPVKLVYIVNRNKRSKYLSILSTDIELSDEEIVSLYARRFSIEGNFYNLKHHLRVNKESQCRSYDSCLAYTVLGMLRFIIIEWMARGNTDGNTVGSLFYQVREKQIFMPFKRSNP